MPFAINQEALDDPSLKVLDLSKPPLKTIPHMEFPRMVYLHPIDKSKEHMAKTVANDHELAQSLARGWRKEPHIPVIEVPEIPEGFEGYESQDPEQKRHRRG